MIWLNLFYTLGTIIFICSVVFSYTLRKDKTEDFIDFIRPYYKVLTAVYLAIIVAITLICSGQIANMTKCAIQGSSMNTQTSYSWVMDECLMKSKTGAMLPIKISRDQPEGNHDTDVSDHSGVN